MTSRSKIIGFVLIGLILSCIALYFISVQVERVEEFGNAERVKGYWASLQEFAGKNGRYPTNDAEIGAFFKMSPKELGQAPVNYLAPQGTNSDEVILWWRQKTLFGVSVGITESGQIIKK